MALLMCLNQRVDRLSEWRGVIRGDSSRDGGTGRRSGLKIRRPLRSWGFDPPSRHQQNKGFMVIVPLDSGEATIVWWLLGFAVAFKILK